MPDIVQLRDVALARNRGDASAGAQGISDAGVRALCKLGGALTALDLAGHNSITNTGAAVMAARLTALQVLDLRCVLCMPASVPFRRHSEQRNLIVRVPYEQACGASSGGS